MTPMLSQLFKNMPQGAPPGGGPGGFMASPTGGPGGGIGQLAGGPGGAPPNIPPPPSDGSKAPMQGVMGGAAINVPKIQFGADGTPMGAATSPLSAPGGAIGELTGGPVNLPQIGPPPATKPGMDGMLGQMGGQGQPGAQPGGMDGSMLASLFGGGNGGGAQPQDISRLAEMLMRMRS